jgi:uncharacterized protein with GYD domain
VVRHVVMWRLADEAADAAKEHNAGRIKEGLEALVGQIEGLADLKVGINAIQLPGNYDIILIADFQDEAALERYQTHPEHVKVANFIKQVRLERVAVDYVI